MTEEPQHLRALRLANETRYARATIRRGILAESPRDGRRMLAAILDNPSPVLNTMRVFDLLCWANGVGPDAAGKMMKPCDVLITARVGRLSDRQRLALAERLRDDRYPDPPPSELPPRKHRAGNRVPAAPLAECLEARIERSKGTAGDARSRVCRQAGISPRNLFAWVHGERERVQVDVADRVLTGLGLNWWDVWDASDPAVVEAWTGEKTQGIAA